MSVGAQGQTLDSDQDLSLLLFFKDTHRNIASICWFTPRWPQLPELGYTKAKSQELLPSLPHGSWRPKHSGHFLLCSQVRELGVESKVEQPGHLLVLM